jgi:predicted AlkP superfamily pyrophosphatase or phosphodiesterase
MAEMRPCPRVACGKIEQTLLLMRSYPLLSLLFAFSISTLVVIRPVQAGRVIFISVDGMRPDAVDVLGPAGAPTFHRLRREGAYTSNARTDKIYTITLPNHTCMVTSRGVVGPEGHNWISNGDPKLGENLHRIHKGYVASMFDVAHDHGLATALYATKSKFSLYDLSYDGNNGANDKTGDDNGMDKIDHVVINEDASALVSSLISDLAAKPADLTMLHLRNCDSAGHAEGWNLAKGTPYLEALRTVDELLGQLLAAINSSPDLKGDTWIVLTADHGGLTGSKGHGESKESDNFTIPFYTWGPGVKAGSDFYELNAASRKDPGKENPAYTEAAQPIRNGDAGNLNLSLLKLPAIPGSTINPTQDLKVGDVP